MAKIYNGVLVDLATLSLDQLKQEAAAMLFAQDYDKDDLWAYEGLMKVIKQRIKRSRRQRRVLWKE